MLVLVAYDIPKNKTRSRLHRFLRQYGLNTQKSIFECDIEPEVVARIKAYVRAELNSEEDAFRMYRMCRRCQKKVAVSGWGIKVVTLDYMVI